MFDFLYGNPPAGLAAQRAELKGQKPCVVWFTGLSGAGKSTTANAVEQLLLKRGCHTYLLDANNLRHGINSDLGFSDADRVENLRRAGEIDAALADLRLQLVGDRLRDRWNEASVPSVPPSVQLSYWQMVETKRY